MEAANAPVSSHRNGTMRCTPSTRILLVMDGYPRRQDYELRGVKYRILERCEDDAAAVERKTPKLDFGLVLVTAPLSLPFGLCNVHAIL